MIFLRKSAVVGIPIISALLVLLASVTAAWEIILLTVGITSVLLIILSSEIITGSDADMPRPVILKNGTLEHAKTQIHNLFSMAESDVSIVTGHFNELLWGEKNILRDLQSFLEKGIRLRVISGSHLYVHKNSELSKLIEEGIKSRRLSFYTLDRERFPHFIVIDDAHVRLEKKHKDDDKERSARIEHYNANLAFHAKITFKKLMEDASSVQDSDIRNISLLETK